MRKEGGPGCGQWHSALNGDRCLSASHASELHSKPTGITAAASNSTDQLYVANQQLLSVIV